MIRTNEAVELKKVGILLIAISIGLSIIFPLFEHQIIRALARAMSLDHRISANGERELTSAFYFVMVMLLGIGLGFARAQNPSWRHKLKQVFLNDPLTPFTPARPSPALILIMSSLVGLLLIIVMHVAWTLPSVFQLLYAKDRGILDLSVSLVMVISAGLLGTVIWKLRSDSRLARKRTLLTLVYLFLAVLFLGYAGEETSWGQDFFGWQTPAVFSGNVEGQTNLHNYFNAIFDYGYIALALVLVLVLVSAWLELHQRWLPFNRLFLPHPSLIGLSLLIAFVAIVWYHEQELLEEMMAAFVFFYSFRLFTCFRSGNISIETSG